MLFNKLFYIVLHYKLRKSYHRSFQPRFKLSGATAFMVEQNRKLKRIHKKVK